MIGALFISLALTACAFIDTMSSILVVFAVSHAFGDYCPRWALPFVSSASALSISLATLIIIRIACRYVANRTSESITQHLGLALGNDMYVSLFNTEKLSDSNANAVGNLQYSNQSVATLSTEGIASLSTYFTSYVPTLFETMFMIPIAAVILLPLNGWSAALVICGMTAMPFAANMSREQDIATQVNQLKQYDNVGVRFEESLRGLNTLKIFGADKREAHKLEQDCEGLRKATMRLLSGQLRSLIGSDMVIYAAAILATLMAVLDAFNNGNHPVIAIAVAISATRLFVPGRQLVYLTHAATVAIKQGKAIAAVRASRDLSEESNTDADTNPPEAMNETADHQHNAPFIACKHVNYIYPNAYQALYDISLSMSSPGHLAIVGSSASGKSTLASIISGRIRGFEGIITMQGKDASTFTARNFIDMCTLIRGNDMCFTGTIRSNLNPMNTSYTDDDLWQALTDVDLQELIKSRGGLDATVQEGGSNFSGGQRQRLSIARGLLKHSPIYIFDEATSAVDSKHDTTIAALMQRLAQRALVITITHRLAGIRDADTIIVLDKGHVLEQGSFAQLMNNNSLFAREWEEQTNMEHGRSPKRGTELSASAISAPNCANEHMQEIQHGRAQDNTAHNTRPNTRHDTRRNTMNTMMRMARHMLPLLPIEMRAIACGCGQHLASIWSVMCATAAVSLLFTAPHHYWWIVLFAAAIILALSRGMLAYAEQLSNHQMAFSTLKDIRTEVFDTMRRLAPAKLSEHGRGNLVTVLTKDIESLEIFYAHTLSPMAIALVTSIINIALFAYLSWPLALVSAISYLLMGIAVPLVSARKAYDASLQEREAEGKLRSAILESLDGREQIVGMGAAPAAAHHLSQLTASLLRTRNNRQQTSGRNNVITESLPLICVTLFTLTDIALATGSIPSLSLTRTAAFTAIAAFATSFPALIAVARLGSHLQPTLAAAQRVFSLFDEQPVVKENPDGDMISTVSSFRADNLSFSYPDAQRATLCNVSFTFNPGEIIGISGANGAGKSTLLDVMMRFRERSSGSLSISGTLIESINTQQLRATEILVAQNTYIFSDTLANNIAIAKPDATHDQINEACHLACLDDLIEALDGGLNHVLIRNGIELSEGQKQRISVARAMLNTSPIALFDEPTSNTDALLEGELMHSLLDHHGTRMYVIVSHRPAVLQYCNRIFALNKGILTQVPQ